MMKMKRMRVLLLALASVASAQSLAVVFDCALDPAYNDGWTSGDNGGSGFGAWSLTGGANAGQFVASSNNNGGGGGPGIDTGGLSWGAWANSGETSAAARSILTPVAVGETFFCQFDNGWIDNGSMVQVGLTAPGSGSVLRFTGGTNNYELIDDAGTSMTSIGFTDRGLILEWTVTSLTSYDFRVIRMADNMTWNTSRNIANASFDRFIFQNINAGFNPTNDAFINSTGVVPEPSSLMVLGLAGIGLLIKRKR